MKKFRQPFYHGKSVTLDWVPNDTEQEFEKHINMYPDSPHLLEYQKNPIKYKLNNYGFRTDDDFSNGDEGTVYLGCSHTYGIGHHLENVWAYKLHQKIGEGKFFNLSCGATGAASHYYFLKYFSDKLKIKKVFHFIPTEAHYRYGFMDKDGKMEVYAQFFHNLGISQIPSLWKRYLIHDTYHNFHNDVYHDATKNLCNEIGCEYIRDEESKIRYRPLGKFGRDGETGLCDPYHKTKTSARDLMHYYIESQHEVYEKFLMLSNKKIGLI